jgi:glycosyltransferase involved in cell wall biosynthesis
MNSAPAPDPAASSPVVSGKPMIFLLIRALTIGGAERQVVQLANALAERGNPVGVVTLYDKGPLEQAIDGRSVRRFSLAKNGRWDIVLPLARLVRLLRRERPAILYAFLPGQTVLAGLIRPVLKPLRLVFALRGSFDYRETDWLQRLAYTLESRFARNVDLIIANSEAGRTAALRRGMPADRVIVIGNLIDTTRFAPNPTARRRQRATWGVADQAKLIGMAARLDPMKGHETFLAAAALLLSHRPESRFVLIGGGPDDYRRRLMSRAQALGLEAALVWAGECRDMPAAYNALDVATLAPDAGEGFPNAVAEAMACGVPVAATDSGDAARLIGATGIIVPPREPARLAAAWTALLDSDRAALGHSARQRILSEFDTGRALDDNLRALMSLIDSPLP